MKFTWNTYERKSDGMKSVDENCNDESIWKLQKQLNFRKIYVISKNIVYSLKYSIAYRLAI